MKGFIHPLNQTIGNQYPVSSRPIPKRSESAPSFSSQFKEAIEREGPLKVSKHAQIRMQQRQIEISPAQWKQVEGKVREAKAKGIKEPLVILKNAALIVSAKNHTVITIMDRQEAGDQIFSNIDGTILMD